MTHDTQAGTQKFARLTQNTHGVASHEISLLGKPHDTGSPHLLRCLMSDFLHNVSLEVTIQLALRYIRPFRVQSSTGQRFRIHSTKDATQLAGGSRRASITQCSMVENKKQSLWILLHPSILSS